MTRTAEDYRIMLPVATDSERQYLEAWEKHGTYKAACEALGRNESSMIGALKNLRVRAAKSGIAPESDWNKPVPEGYMVKGVSSYYNRDGELTGQWVKSSADKDQQHQLMLDACEAMVYDLPKAKPTKAPDETIKNLMAVYPIGDAHIGMRAWGEETQGQDWDMTIATRIQCGAMAALVDLAPNAEEAVIINLGDWFHADNMSGMTERSGHVMDLDGRYAKMIDVGVMVMRQCIESALKKHKRVRVINVIGNHDDTGALWMSVALRHTYANEPRITIDKEPSAFHYIRWGNTFVGTTHGHTCKADKLPGVMATDKARDWGETEYRYWYCGHVHHESVKEYAGVTVETFNTLTAKDAWSAFAGHRARQNMKCIVLHNEYGEVCRHTIHPDMLK